jgi:hypothetical protein
MNRKIDLESYLGDLIVEFGDERVIGQELVSYQLKISDSDAPMRLQYLLTNTRAGSGVAFFERQWQSLDDFQFQWVYRRVSELGSAPRFVVISALDAAMSGKSYEVNCTETKFFGTVPEKAEKRADVIARQAKIALDDTRKNCRQDFVLVGYVGALYRRLGEYSNSVAVTDNNYEFLNAHESTANIRPGNETLQNIKNSKVALVTGMTLVNGTFFEIADACAKYDTRLVVFAQSGSNIFLRLFGEMPQIDVVIGETYPFYSSDAKCSLSTVCSRLRG